MVAGAIYALVAASFSIIYATNKFLHLAHGAVLTLNAYFLYFFFTVLGLNFVLSIILTFSGATLVGFVVSKFYKQLRDKQASSATLLLGSIALMIFIDSLILLLFEGNAKTIGLLKVTQGIELLQAIITPLQISIIIMSLFVLLVLSLFIKKSKLGTTLRAVADTPEQAEILGISANQVYTASFIIGSIVATLAGILYGLEHNLTPTMGIKLVFTGFAAAVVGGIGSIQGAVLGASLFSLVENFGIWYLPSGYKDAIAFMVLFLFLTLRPQGIFGFKNKISL